MLSILVIVRLWPRVVYLNFMREGTCTMHSHACIHGYTTGPVVYVYGSYTLEYIPQPQCTADGGFHSIHYRGAFDILARHSTIKS